MCVVCVFTGLYVCFVCICVGLCMYACVCLCVYVCIHAGQWLAQNPLSYKRRCKGGGSIHTRGHLIFKTLTLQTGGFVCMYAYTPYVCSMPLEIRRYRTLWNQSYRWLWATMWVIGTKPWSFAEQQCS